MHDFKKYTALSANDSLREFDVTPESGLSASKIKEIRLTNGKNDLPKKETSWVQILSRQFKSAFIYLLIAASAVTFFLGERLDSVLILGFITINVLLGFFQEYKSEQTTKLLKKYTNKRATVIRDGEEINIDATDLVPGDIVVIETGDIIPADLRLIKINSLLVDESTLTGESIQISKNAETLEAEQTDLFKAINIAFSGTTVVEGWALGVVIATGRNTQFGRITQLTTTVDETSAFEKQIDKFSQFILFLILITLAAVFIVHILFKNSLSPVDLLIFSIALAVGVIPEGMPLVTTFSLSLGASQLARKKVVVKRLSAIQDLGEIEILCTDKTGTITENKLEVADIFSDIPETAVRLAAISASSQDRKATANNSFDLAISKYIEGSYPSLSTQNKRVFEIPFNPNRRRNSVLADFDNKRVLIVRGSAEGILPHITALSPALKKKIAQWNTDEGNAGRRVIAVAFKNFSGDTYTAAEEEKGLKLAGLVAFNDPVKKTSYEAIKKCAELGIRAIMITGDSPSVAAAVGVEVGLAHSLQDVITGDDFDALSKEAQKEATKNINVFARMSPEQKFKLIKYLQEKNVVGYLGEGINDAPAIKAAAVSIVVDDASDVSREVADIILLEHDLKVIVDGIELGRKTFVNVTNYVKATLASNFGNFYAMVFVTLIIDYLPMLPVQILLVNLLSDFPMISIATDNVDKADIQMPKKYAMKEFMFIATLLGLVSTVFDFMMFGIFKNYGENSLRTYWFIGSILTELVLIYSIRTKGWFFMIKKAPSKILIILTAAAAVATVVIPFTSFGMDVFKFIVPAPDKLLLILAIVAGYLLSTEVVKKIYAVYLEPKS